MRDDEEQTRLLRTALLAFAMSDRARDGRGPCWCKFSGDDHRPGDHSEKCWQARAAYAFRA